MIDRPVELFRAPPGKFRVSGQDRFDYSRYPAGDYDTAAEALSGARADALEGAGSASDPSIADVYEVYDDQGRYLGGDQPLDDWFEAHSILKKTPFADRASAVAERLGLKPLLHRAECSRIDGSDHDRASAICQEAAASLGWQFIADRSFGGSGLPVSRFVRCQTADEPAVDVEFRLKEVWGNVEVEIEAFVLLQGAPEPLLAELAAVVGKAKKAVEESRGLRPET